MNNTDKLAKIAAKDFTYCQVFVEPLPDMPLSNSVSFVVLTPSKPLAKTAAKQIVESMGRTIKQCVPYGKTTPVDKIHVYPRTYVREAKAMLKERPGMVYEVAEITSVSVAA